MNTSRFTFALRYVAIAFALCSLPLSAKADSLDVPGSIPGTTTVFATEGPITVGTYYFQGNPNAPDSLPSLTNLPTDLWNSGLGVYGFIYNGSTYQTFLPPSCGANTGCFAGYLGAPPSYGSNPFGAEDYDLVTIYSFNLTGGIGYTMFNPVQQADGDGPAYVNSGIQTGFSNEVDLTSLVVQDGYQYVTDPDGQQVYQVWDFGLFPTSINSIGQVTGAFVNGVTAGGCENFYVTCGGQFLYSDGNLYFNYTVDNVNGSELGYTPDEQITGFVENGNSGTYRPVPGPNDLLMFGTGLLLVLCYRKKLVSAF